MLNGLELLMQDAQLSRQPQGGCLLNTSMQLFYPKLSQANYPGWILLVSQKMGG
jgi:hypothetical protein